MAKQPFEPFTFVCKKQQAASLPSGSIRFCRCEGSYCMTQMMRRSDILQAADPEIKYVTVKGTTITCHYEDDGLDFDVGDMLPKRGE